ncbi:MAG: polysaccharide pyruvyl transferase family protein [Cyanobacteria bacterium J06555_13]
MKLFYYQRPDGQPNFGDELNHWLWPQLCSDIFDDDDKTVFVGTGTLLNNKLGDRISNADQLTIFSTGAGYEQPMKRIPTHWHIHCVRGPFSARLLGLPEKKAITDGGVLVATVFQSASPRTGCSFMPHIHSADAAADRWQRICEQADIHYIDPRWPIEKILEAIASSTHLIAEAMHGAIVADALRVPWTPVTSSPRIYAFKWQDWCASMQLPYLPHRLPPLIDYPRWGRGLRSGTFSLRHWLRSGLESPGTTLEYAVMKNDAAIVRRLRAVANAHPYLSKEETFQERLGRLQTCFEGFVESVIAQKESELASVA